MSAMTGIPSPLWTENKRLETANAELRARVAELEAERISLDEARTFCDNYNAALSNAELRKRVAELEARVIAASDTVYDLISELADATGMRRSEIEAAFLGEVQS